MDAAKFLRQIPLFKECREADLNRVAAICEEEVHREGKVYRQPNRTRSRQARRWPAVAR